jgi:hypothetical protein
MPDALLPAIQPAVTRGTIAEGNKGARFSLEEVARKASEGRNHPVVQAWTTHCLRAAGDPQTAEGMAKAILDAQRKQMVYKSDPLGTEFIAAAHLTLSDYFAGGDCDCLTVAFLACCLNAGLDCAVVGHALGPSKTIEHVLGAVWIPHPKGNGGTWKYAEPSHKTQPFGQWVVAPTWERVLGLPVQNGTPQVICDANTCLKRADVRPIVWRGDGDFIGVSGIRNLEASSPEEPPGRIRIGVGNAFHRRVRVGLSGPFDAASAAFLQEVRSMRDGLEQALNDAFTAHNTLQSVAQSAGLTFPETSQASPNSWTSTNETLYQAQQAAGWQTVSILNDVLNGLRSSAPTTDPSTGESTIGFAQLPSDTVVVDDQGTLSTAPPLPALSAQRGPAPYVLQIPTGVVVLAGFAASVAIVYLITKAMSGDAAQCNTRVNELYAACVQNPNAPNCGPEMLALINANTANLNAAAQGSTLVQATNLVGQLTIAAGVAAAIYTAYELWSTFRPARRTAA